jgi:hypothetical protein
MWIFGCGGCKEFGVCRADKWIRRITAMSREYL